MYEGRRELVINSCNIVRDGGQYWKPISDSSLRYGELNSNKFM